MMIFESSIRYKIIIKCMYVETNQAAYNTVLHNEDTSKWYISYILSGRSSRQ